MAVARPVRARRGRRPTLVCLRALGLGDLLTALPALRALAAAFPDHRRVLATRPELAPIVELLEHRWDIADLPDITRPPPSTVRGAEVAVNLHGRGPQSHRLLLASEPGRMIAFACPPAGFAPPGAPRWRAGEHEVRRWCRLLNESGLNADPRHLRLRRPALAGNLAGAASRHPDGLTVIHPGAAFEARRWPAERFAAVARREARAGRRIIVTGTARERDLAAAVVALAELPEAANLAGRTGLRDLAALTGAAGRVICGDTGVGHLATALGVPSVLIFGPTAPFEWGPLIDRDRHQVLWPGRRGDPNADRTDPGLLDVEVADVLVALDALEARFEGRAPRESLALRPRGAVASRIGVVIATRNRRLRLSETLRRIEALPERPAIVVVDNASRDGTAEHVRRHHPAVGVVRLAENLGAAARNAGAAALDVPYVAISDDDSWWEPGALRRAAVLFDRHPRLGLVAARVIVEPEGRIDSTCLAMRRSPLSRFADLPGLPVLGFVACGSIVRRSALSSVGGFSTVLRVGGEETMLALDLEAAGWGVSYVDEVIAHHQPAPRDGGAVAERQAIELRNALWTMWLRRPAASAMHHSVRLVAGAARRGELRGVLAAFRGLGPVLRMRRSIPPELERRLVAVERCRGRR